MDGPESRTTDIEEERALQLRLDMAHDYGPMEQNQSFGFKLLKQPHILELRP